jgi:uncharacterized RDD family membrane protein YckC
MNQQAPVGYVGFVTRAVALTIDAVVINVIAVLVGGAVNLVASLLGGNGGLSAVEAAAGGAVWFLWSGAYFVAFWTLTGQTPGDRLLGFRVFAADGGPVRTLRGIRRFAGMIISMIPLGAGFLPVLVDDRRRGLHDRLAGTVVRWDAEEPAEVVPDTVHVHPLTPALGPGPTSAVPPPAPAGGPEVPIA